MGPNDPADHADPVVHLEFDLHRHDQARGHGLVVARKGPEPAPDLHGPPGSLGPRLLLLAATDPDLAVLLVLRAAPALAHPA